MAKPKLRLVVPATENRTVGAKANPGRQPNAAYRTREYLTDAEVARLQEAAKRNRWGHRDATMILVAYRHGFHPWTEDEIEQYKLRHAAGTKARLALELLLQTGHARSDITRMGRQHVRGGMISMRRKKTGVQFDIPMLPDLAAEIERHPKTDQLAFLITERGEPFTAQGFGNWFAERCKEAGVPGRAHGLRKASAVRHALKGATASELMAWFGWKTIGEAQRYVETANRIKLAQSAGAKIISGTGVGSPSNPVSQNEPQPVENAGAAK
jgi:integrase